MKHIFLIFFVLISCQAFSQNEVQNFKTYNIENSSCQIFNSVNVELSKTGNKISFIQARIEEQKKYPLNDSMQIHNFINEFNSALDKTKKQYESQELLWSTGKELGKYGLSVLSKYAESLPTKHLTNFLTPAIEQGFELYVDHLINEGIEGHKDDIDKLIKDRFDLLYSNGIDVRMGNDEQSFSDFFALAHGDVSALSRDQYGAFTKELTKRAYDFMKKDREHINLIDLKTTLQYDQVKKDVDAKLQLFQKSISDEVTSSLKTLGNSVAQLTQNQIDIFESLDEIQKRIISNENEIRQLEKSMIDVQGDVEALKTIQEEHDRLIAQNSFQIDILSGYTFQNLNTDQKINALKNGHFDNIFTPADKQKLIDELDKIKTSETILSVCNSVNEYSSQSYDALTKAGLLKGEDAKRVSMFLFYLNGLTQTAAGVGKLYGGDVTGVFNVVSGLGRVISGYKEPEKSPELKMMEQMYSAMNQGFQNIDQHLARIETKIDTLTSVVYSMYKSIMLSFQYVNKEFEVVNWKLDNLQNLSRTFFYTNYNSCKTINEVRLLHKNQLQTYSDYQDLAVAPCLQCLQGLNDLTITNDFDFFFMTTSIDLSKFKPMEIEVREIYDPTKDLFKSFYSNNFYSSLYALMFPTALTSDANKPLVYTSKISSFNFTTQNDVIENYYNYELVSEFDSTFLTYAGFFEIASKDYSPMTLSTYLLASEENSYNHDILEKRLIKLLNLTQYSIAQQSLLAGNEMLDGIYSTLFSYNTIKSEQDLSIKVLRANKLLSKNFTTYLINKNIKTSDTLLLKSLYENAVTSQSKLDSLNALISLNDFSFFIKNNDNNLYISFSRNGEKIELLCPSFSALISNQMTNTEALFDLLQMRQAIYERLIDLSFIKNISASSTDSSTINKFKYYYPINESK